MTLLHFFLKASIPAVLAFSVMDFARAHEPAHPLLPDPKNTCVTLKFRTKTDNAARADVDAVVSMMNRNPATRRAIRLFESGGGSICVVNLGDWDKQAFYINTLRAIVIDKSSSEGCRVSQTAHEVQHGLQQIFGIIAPYPNLTSAAQEDLILSVEADASAVQVWQSWILASPRHTAEPYEGARQCLEDMAGKDPDTVPLYLLRALNDLDSMQSQPGSDQAAPLRVLRDRIRADRGFTGRYIWPIVFLYTGLDDTSFREDLTLEDAGIDLSVIARIHAFPAP